MNILLIDDHALSREGLKFLLRNLDAELEVDEAADCARALEHAALRDRDPRSTESGAGAPDVSTRS